jgi:DNA-binding response OmpR family regulator
MANPINSKRPCIMIVDHDLDYGITLADRLAAHGYQAVLIRSMETAIDECRDLCPQAVFIGLSFSAPATTLSLRRLLRTIKAVSPHVPVITMGAHISRDQTDNLNSGSLRRLHLPIKPVELTYVCRLLQSELNAAAGAPTSSKTKPDPYTSRAAENRVSERSLNREAKAWIA